VPASQRAGLVFQPDRTINFELDSGPMNTILFYWMLIVVMVIWMAVKVGRSSVGMGVVTFLFWPVAIVPLITNWGQRGSDIRLQFLVTVLATGLLWKNLIEVAADTERMLAEDQIALVSAGDSVYAMQIEAERDGVRDRATAQGVGGQSAALSTQPDVQFAPAMARVHATPLHEIRFRSGAVALGPAYSSLDVPRHFRFIARHQLGLLSELRGIPVGQPHILGWIVHERVNLKSADFWFVEVSFHEVGHLAPPAPGSTESAMQWDAATATAIWGQPAMHSGRGIDQSAVKLTRHGAILFRAPELKQDQLELGLRAVRLMASRTEPASGWAYAEYIGDSSAQTLAQWTESLKFPAEPAVVAERDDGQSAL
jgi:hypothetical protein